MNNPNIERLKHIFANYNVTYFSIAFKIGISDSLLRKIVNDGYMPAKKVLNKIDRFFEEKFDEVEKGMSKKIMPWMRLDEDCDGPHSKKGMTQGKYILWIDPPEKRGARWA